MTVLQVDPGGEIYIPFAKKKLRDWHAEMLRYGTHTLDRVIEVSEGSRIYISSVLLGNGAFRDSIRITFGGVDGRYWHDGTFGSPDQFFLVKKGRAASNVDAPAAGFFSYAAFNGFTISTLSAPSGSGFLSLSLTRGARTEWIAPASGHGMFVGKVFGFGFLVDDLWGATFAGSGEVSDDYWGVNRESGGSPDVAVTHDGKYAAWMSSHQYPAVARLDSSIEEEELLPKSEWVISESRFNVVTVGIPGPVAEFYAARTIPHTIGEIVPSPGSSTADGFPAHALFLPATRWFSPYYLSVTGSVGSNNFDSILFSTNYDPFNDEIYCLAMCPWASSDNLIDSGYDLAHEVRTSVTWMLMRFSRETHTWSLVFEETFGDVFYHHYQERGPRDSGAAALFSGISRGGIFGAFQDTTWNGLPVFFRSTAGVQLGEMGTGFSGGRTFFSPRIGEGAKLLRYKRNVRFDVGVQSQVAHMSLNGATADGFSYNITALAGSAGSNLEFDPSAESALFADGVKLFDMPKIVEDPGLDGLFFKNFVTIAAAAKDGYLFTNRAANVIPPYSADDLGGYWKYRDGGGWGEFFEPLDVLAGERRLSPDGTRMFSGLLQIDSEDVRYYERGALKYTFPHAPSPLPQSGPFLSPPPAGYFFIGQFNPSQYLWQSVVDPEAIKVLVFTHATLVVSGATTFYDWHSVTAKLKWDEGLGSFKVVDTYRGSVTLDTGVQNTVVTEARLVQDEYVPHTP